jgi:hypothetical protein
MLRVLAWDWVRDALVGKGKDEFNDGKRSSLMGVHIPALIIFSDVETLYLVLSILSKGISWLELLHFLKLMDRTTEFLLYVTDAAGPHVSLQLWDNATPVSIAERDVQQCWVCYVACQPYSYLAQSSRGWKGKHVPKRA